MGVEVAQGWTGAARMVVVVPGGAGVGVAAVAAAAVTVCRCQRGVSNQRTRTSMKYSMKNGPPYNNKHKTISNQSKL